MEAETKIIHDMKNFTELLKRRRSTRKFTEEKINQDDVVELLKAALMAPSSKRSTPWEFVVVDEPDKLKALSQCKQHGAKLIEGAPLAIVILADPMISDVWIEDTSIATTLLQLQAEALGLGSCWVQVRGRSTAAGIPADENVREILDIPLQMQVLSIVAIGHKDEEKQPFDEEKLKWEKIHINQFGGIE